MKQAFERFSLKSLNIRGVFRTSLLKLFSENSQWLSTLNYFRKQALSKMFDKVLKATLAMVKPRSSLRKIFLKICLK